jgi:glycosyltransferase involved in cell wall biosynthesis
LRPWLTLRRLVRSFNPDLIHAWGLPAFRAVTATAPRGVPLLLSGLAQGATSGPGILDRSLLRCRVRCVLTAGAAENMECLRLGLPPSCQEEISPGVAPANSVTESRAALCRTLGLGEKVRFLACIGPLERAKGFRDAIWAFDILQYLYDDLHLLLIGTGPDEGALRDFRRITRTTKRVHFLGCQADAAALLEHVDLVWVPSRANRGVNAALEGMAAGRPVIASRCQALAEVVVDGETGLLIPSGQPGALARETRLLLDAPERCRLLGEAGRRRALERFSIETLVQRHSEVYLGSQVQEVTPNRSPGEK